MTDTGCGPGGGDRPGRNVEAHPAKAAQRHSRAIVAQHQSGCECRTYCTECQLWPFRAALSETWRVLESLGLAA